MSECRICFSSDSQNLISPCKCKGSIQKVHSECLMKWLKKKSPTSYRSVILKEASRNFVLLGLHCELCKYEYKGKVAYLKFFAGLKKMKNCNATYYLIMNLPIIIYLTYKFKSILGQIFLFAVSQIQDIKKLEKFREKLKKIVFFSAKLGIQIFSIFVYGTALPLIGVNSLKLILKILSEFRVIQFENCRH